MSEGRRCKVVLLNGQRLDIIVQSKLKTSDLIEITLSHFFVKEQQCFGLYTVQSNYVYWLDPKKNVLENEFLGGEGPITIYLGVRFYMKSTSMLSDLKAIELFYLQTRCHISQGLLICEAPVLCHLAALALQFEHKDFQSDEQFASILARSQVLPSRLPKDSTLDYESETRQRYKDLVGMSRGEALVMYLKTVESQPSYGVHFYSVKDKRGASNWLGISLNGIVVVERDHRKSSTPQTKTYKWCQLENIFHNDKKFHFEERRLTSDARHQAFPSSDVILHSFISDTPSMARCIWSSCVDQHHFYLETIKTDPVRVELDKLAKELDESFIARKQGHHIETFHSERFKQMREVVQQLKSKKSLLDSLLRDKMNLIRRLEEEETAVSKMPPRDVHPIDKHFKEKWETAVISYDHYEANKTLSALDDIFKVEQKITVGYYKLIILHNNSTARIVNRMVTLQMTPGKDFMSKNEDMRKKWAEKYKTSLGKLKAVERKLNKYRGVLNMAYVHFASRFEDHKITQRPISDAQKQMVCRCPSHSHRVLHRQHENKRESESMDPVKSSEIAVRSCNAMSSGSISSDHSRNSTRCPPPPPNLQLPPIPDEEVSSPSVVSTAESTSSSSSSSSLASHRYIVPISSSSSSSSIMSSLSSPYVLESRFVYPESKQRTVTKNHSCDDLGIRPSIKDKLKDPMSSDSLEMRNYRGVEGHDRSVRGLNKRYSYRMALESNAIDVRRENAEEDDDEEEEEEGEGNHNEDDNLYNVSNNRKTHVLTRSCSTNQGPSLASCQHDHHSNRRHIHQPNANQQTWQNSVKHHHCHHHQYLSPELENRGSSLQKCPSDRHAPQCYQNHRHHTHQHHHHHHRQHHRQQHNSHLAGLSCSSSQDQELHGGDARRVHPKKTSGSELIRSRPSPHVSDDLIFLKAGTCDPSNHVYQRIPFDKSSSSSSGVSTTSLKMKPSSSTLPRAASSSVNCALFDLDISTNLTSCFRIHRKSTDSTFDEPNEACKPHSSLGFGEEEQTPRSEKSSIAKNNIVLDDSQIEERRPFLSQSPAGLSFVRFIESTDREGLPPGLITTSLFLDTSASIRDSYVQELLRDQHLRMEDYNKCMEHFRHLQINNFHSSGHGSSSRDSRRGTRHQTFQNASHHGLSHPTSVQNPHESETKVGSSSRGGNAIQRHPGRLDRDADGGRDRVRHRFSHDACRQHGKSDQSKASRRSDHHGNQGRTNISGEKNDSSRSERPRTASSQGQS